MLCPWPWFIVKNNLRYPPVSLSVPRPSSLVKRPPIERVCAAMPMRGAAWAFQCGLVEQVGPGRWKVSRPAPRARAWPGFQQHHWLGLVLKPHKVPGPCPDAAPDL